MRWRRWQQRVLHVLLQRGAVTAMGMGKGKGRIWGRVMRSPPAFCFFLARSVHFLVSYSVIYETYTVTFEQPI
uniref:Uncharacterized protein n=1 Tax=Oryza sativa subsp. japonica TaxID=39947 RepID=Q6YVG1_ORYSJ|nr:hypothetical protein [Oryza sativa Japonica Group]